MQAFSYEENKIKLHDVGHMTKMAAMPIYIMNLSKYSPEPLDRFARNFVCSIYIKHIKVCINNAPVICIPGSLGARDSGDIAGLSAGILPPMSPGSAVDVPGF